MSKTVMYEIWHEYMKLKHGEKQNYVTWTQTVFQS